MLWLVFTESSTVFSMGEKYSLPVIEGHTKESVLGKCVLRYKQWCYQILFVCG